MTNLLRHYEKAIAQGEIQEDPLQKEVLLYLQKLSEEIKAANSWKPWKKAPKGLYIHGSVGAGKTYLVDLFYNKLEERKKARFHFHHFMQQIDLKLRKLQGQKDPLKSIAKELAKTTKVLCFDEFLVHDVAYAMILAELLKALIDQKVILVFSSNTPPDELYLNGVQRARFLKAIALIKKHCEVLTLVNNRDYRYEGTILKETYLFPINEQTNQTLLHEYNLLSPNSSAHGLLKIQNRDIPYLYRSEKTIWFDFKTLCSMPRSQLDYLEIADLFEVIFLSDVPKLTENHTVSVILFIHLIDVLYDRGIKLIISAQSPLEELYLQGEMLEPFKRTLSRLQEMQTDEYLNRSTRRVVQNM